MQKRIIDLGCGKNKYPNSTGLDKKKFKDTDILCDLEHGLPIKSNCIDTVVASEVFEHIKGVINLTREIYRVLKNNGKLIVEVPYHGTVKNIIIALFFFDRHYALANPNEESTHLRFFTLNTLKNLLERFNFKIISVSYQGRFYPLYKTMTIIGKKMVK